VGEKAMYEVGEKLKDARMAKGYTLDDLQQITKIQKRYLTAIEDGRFEVLPGNFYVRAFIKQYAEVVGLDGDQLVEEYNENTDGNTNKKKRQSAETYSRLSSNKGGVWETIKDSLPMILIVVLIIAIIVSIYIASSQMDNGNGENIINEESQETEFITNESEQTSEQNSNNSETSGNEQSSENNEQSNENEGNSQTLEVESSDSTSTNYIVSGEHPETQTVELRVPEGGSSWVSISVDGNVQEQGALQNGQSFEVEFDSNVGEIHTVIGYSPDTEVYLNDQLVEYEEEVADTDRIEMTFTFE